MIHLTDPANIDARRYFGKHIHSVPISQRATLVFLGQWGPSHLIAQLVGR